MTAITPTSLLNTGLQSVGSVSQGAAQLTSNAQSEVAKTDAAGTSKSVTAQRAANEAQDKNGAEMTNLLSQQTMLKQEQDTMNSIASMKMDSFNKELSMLSKNATGINF